MTDVSVEAFRVARERYDASGDWRLALEGAFSVLLADARVAADRVWEGEVAFARSERDRAFEDLDRCKVSLAEFRSELALVQAEMAALRNLPEPPADRVPEVAAAVADLAAQTRSSEVGQVADFIVHRFLS